MIGVLNTIEPAIQAMTKRGAGTIAMIGSMAGVRGLPFMPAYCASKAAVYSYAESLRGVLSPHGVDVCMIVPGFIATPMTAGNKSWLPGLMSDAKAADIIAREVERRKPVIAFPLLMWYALRFLTVPPPRWVDALIAALRRPTGVFEMSGRHILITGASSGIGRALALRYAQEGARLSLLGRDAARLELSAQACRDKGAAVASFVVDVQNRAGMAKAVADALTLAPLDILFANAGVATGLSSGQILEDPEAVRATLAINVIGVFNTVEPAIQAMTKEAAERSPWSARWPACAACPFRRPIVQARRRSIPTPNRCAACWRRMASTSR